MIGTGLEDITVNHIVEHHVVELHRLGLGQLLPRLESVHNFVWVVRTLGQVTENGNLGSGRRFDEELTIEGLSRRSYRPCHLGRAMRSMVTWFVGIDCRNRREHYRTWRFLRPKLGIYCWSPSVSHGHRTSGSTDGEVHSRLMKRSNQPNHSYRRSENKISTSIQNSKWIELDG